MAAMMLMLKIFNNGFDFTTFSPRYFQQTSTHIWLQLSEQFKAAFCIIPVIFNSIPISLEDVCNS